MASLSFSEEGFSCIVCRGRLSCSHSSHKACLQKCRTYGEKKERPLCKKTNKRKDPSCDAFVLEKRPKMDPKESAEQSLRLLQKKLKVFRRVKTNCEQTAEHIKAQTQNTERKIKEQFEKLRQFLRMEEEARITALREEESIKSQMMKEKIDDLNREMSTLANKIRAIEEELRAGHVTQNYKVQLTPQDPQLVSGALIDEAKHLGNLAFRVWHKMKDTVSYTPVVLDPNTVHPRRILSDDLTAVRRGEEERRPPDNPERFDWWYRVLGSEGFSSGTHCWDVEVGEAASWTLGVLAESYQRKGQRLGVHWSVHLYDGQYTAGSRGSATVLSVKRKPRRIRLQLNWNRGTLSFSDPDSDTHLHTFRHTFTDTLFPYIYNGDDTLPLKMLPRRISVIKHV